MAKARRTDGGFSSTKADRHGHYQPLFVLFCSRNETKKREAASWCPRGYRLPVFPRDFATSCVSFGLLFQAKAVSGRLLLTQDTGISYVSLGNGLVRVPWKNKTDHARLFRENFQTFGLDRRGRNDDI